MDVSGFDLFAMKHFEMLSYSYILLCLMLVFFNCNHYLASIWCKHNGSIVVDNNT